MYQIRDTTTTLDNSNGSLPSYRAPDPNSPSMQIYRFLHPPPNASLTDYPDTRAEWDADVHLQCGFVYLGEDERQIFQEDKRKYMFVQVHEKKYHNLTGPETIDLNSYGMVRSWMFYFQRSDIAARNEWSNYTNWPIHHENPMKLVHPETIETTDMADYNAQVSFVDPNDTNQEIIFTPASHPDGIPTNYKITPSFQSNFDEIILQNMAILLDGTEREQSSGWQTYQYIQPYRSSNGRLPPGLYYYNFCLDTSLSNECPSGQMNMSPYKRVQMNMDIMVPPPDPYATSTEICDPMTGDIIGVNQPASNNYLYTYDLVVFEESLNFITINNGFAEVKWG